MAVGSLERQLQFYEALGFSIEARSTLAGPSFVAFAGVEKASAELAWLCLGDERLALLAYHEPRGAEIDEGYASDDQSFQHTAIVVGNVDRALATLAARSDFRMVSKGPQTIPLSNPTSGGVRTVYLRGPERHPIELIAFPADKGERRWHHPATGFLGIDHSAIVVTSTARSRSFYEGLLGFTCTASGRNEGPEQEALSAVDDATVQITSLRGASGPGIELLEYVRPRDGKRFPHAEAADHVRSETWIEVSDLASVAERLEAGHVEPLPVVEIGALGIGFALSCRVRDPDHHGLRLLQREAVVR